MTIILPPRSVLTEQPVSAALLKEYSTSSQEEINLRGVSKNTNYKASFDYPAPEESLTEYTKEGFGFYGAGIRGNPKTNELLAMYLTGDYQKNLLVRFNAATGEKISEIAYDGYYYPATFIFN